MSLVLRGVRGGPGMRDDGVERDEAADGHSGEDVTAGEAGRVWLRALG